MQEEFIRPERMEDPSSRPMLMFWLKNGFRSILRASKSPLFKLLEVDRHTPQEIRAAEGVVEGLELARYLKSAGYTRVTRIRISETERLVVWTAAFAEEYRTWSPSRLHAEVSTAAERRRVAEEWRRIALQDEAEKAGTAR